MKIFSKVIDKIFANNNLYYEFYKYIPLKLKKKVNLLIPLLSISGMLEVASLAALIPLISILLNSSNKNIYLIDFLGLTSLTKLEQIGLLFLFFMIIIIIKGLYIFRVTKLYYNTVLLIKGSIQKKLFISYLNQDYIKSLNSNTAEYIRNITTECNLIENRFILPTISLLAEIFPVIFIGSFLFYINPLGVILILTVFVISGIIITKFTSNNLKKYGKGQLTADGKQIKIAKEAFASLQEIKLYKCEKQVFKLYEQYVDQSVMLWSNGIGLQQIPKFSLEIIGLLTIGIIAAISLLNGLSGEQVLLEITIFIAAIVKMMPSANRIVSNIQSLIHSRSSLLNILNELKSFSEKENTIDENSMIFQELNTISLNNISHKHKNRNEFVFNNLNLEIKRGEIIGLKGESGSGKSTLINIILGFITPIHGTVLMNNLDINHSLATWQNKISYVPQDVILFDDTLINNITFYNSIDVSELSKLLAELNLDTLIDELPEGLETRVGEGGSLLSGGQKQRIGIARAIIRNPEFLILDEATSALDVESEIAVNKLLNRLKINTTIFIVAHKNSAFEICDKIFQFNNKCLHEIKNNSK